MNGCPSDPLAGLSAREREIMLLIYRLGEATAADVEQAMESPPTNATVRTILRSLEEKGWVTHGRDGARFVYRAMEAGSRVRRRALEHVVQTFFRGSTAEVVASLIGSSEGLAEEERARIAELLESLDGEGA